MLRNTLLNLLVGSLFISPVMTVVAQNKGFQPKYEIVNGKKKLLPNKNGNYDDQELYPKVPEIVKITEVFEPVDTRILFKQKNTKTNNDGSDYNHQIIDGKLVPNVKKNLYPEVPTLNQGNDNTVPFVDLTHKEELPAGNNLEKKQPILVNGQTINPAPAAQLSKVMIALIGIGCISVVGGIVYLYKYLKAKKDADKKKEEKKEQANISQNKNQTETQTGK